MLCSLILDINHRWIKSRYIANKISLNGPSIRYLHKWATMCILNHSVAGGSMKRTSRCLFVDWKALHGKRKLIIRENDKHMFTCPVKLSLHGDFKSMRGLRKHIDNKHQWYYYIDDVQPAKKKVCTSSKPAFSLIEGIGQDFLTCTTCGGGKN